MSQPSYNHDRLLFVVDNLKKKKMNEEVGRDIQCIRFIFPIKLGKVWINLFYTA
jgi:hypothetical protein